MSGYADDIIVDCGVPDRAAAFLAKPFTPDFLLHKVREALSGGFADSRILELHGQRMIDGEFAPGGRATVQLKDVEQALELAEQIGLDIPSLVFNKTLWEKMIEMGFADARLLEGLGEENDSRIAGTGDAYIVQADAATLQPETVTAMAEIEFLLDATGQDAAFHPLAGTRHADRCDTIEKADFAAGLTEPC